MESTNHENIYKSFISGKTEITNLLSDAADQGIDIEKYVNLKNADGLTALQVAVSQCREDSHLDVIRELIAMGASLEVTDHCGLYPLHVLVKNERNIKTLELFMIEGDDVIQPADNECNEKPLHLAAGYNNSMYIQILINYGASIDDRDNIGRTPLHWAVGLSKNDSDLVTVSTLLAYNADPNAKDDYGDTPLHHAFLGGNNNREANYQTVALLLRTGANVNAVNIYGNTALHLAANKNIPNITELLRSKGARVDLTNECGWTPISYAIMDNNCDSHLQTIKVLLAGGKASDVNYLINDTTYADTIRKTPLDILTDSQPRFNLKTWELFLHGNAEFFEEDTRRDYFIILRKSLIMVLKLMEQKNQETLEQFKKKHEEKLKNLDDKFINQRIESSKLEKKYFDALKQLEKKHNEDMKNLKGKFIVQHNESLKLMEKKNTENLERLEKKHQDDMKNLEANLKNKENIRNFEDTKDKLRIIERNVNELVKKIIKTEKPEKRSSKVSKRMKKYYASKDDNKKSASVIAIDFIKIFSLLIFYLVLSIFL